MNSISFPSDVVFRALILIWIDSERNLSAMGVLSTLQGQYTDWTALVLIILALIFVIRLLVTPLKPGLRSIPEPFLARFSPFYRLLKISKGNAPVFYWQLHETYGPIVRTGPNTVDITDPKAVPIIYGINSKFFKVCIPSVRQ